MNSQVYCLPQTFGWNSFNVHTPEQEEQKERYRNWRSKRPYSRMNLDKCDHDPANAAKLKDLYPHLPSPSPLYDQVVREQSLMTTFKQDYGPDKLPPIIRPCPPISYETMPDPVRYVRKWYDLPFDEVMGKKVNQDKGEYSYRGLRTAPTYAMWEKVEKIPLLTNVGKRSTLPPVRVNHVDGTEQKTKWDSARNLVRQNAVNKAYRHELPGYAAHEVKEDQLYGKMEKDVHHPNPAMQSTAQATYRALPTEMYEHYKDSDEEKNKHMGPLSRMVTITHPFNPFTQQSAYCNVGATGTQ